MATGLYLVGYYSELSIVDFLFVVRSRDVYRQPVINKIPTPPKFFLNFSQPDTVDIPASYFL